MPRQQFLAQAIFFCQSLFGGFEDFVHAFALESKAHVSADGVKESPPNRYTRSDRGSYAIAWPSRREGDTGGENSAHVFVPKSYAHVSLRRVDPAATPPKRIVRSDSESYTREVALRPGGLLLVNSPVSPCSLALHASAIVCIDADRIARGTGLGSQVATAMLGAFAAATELVSLVDLALSLTEAGAQQKPQSVEACMQGYFEAAGIEVEVT